MKSILVSPKIFLQQRIFLAKVSGQDEGCANGDIKTWISFEESKYFNVTITEINFSII